MVLVFDQPSMILLRSAGLVPLELREAADDAQVVGAGCDDVRTHRV
jgi:hypothetical protein